ncbi:MAG: FHA domain-containing protein [Deltaproteobacteria bacterium]|nr:FHA domain-containing protein [Deltaproteobacteria bacterium]
MTRLYILNGPEAGRSFEIKDGVTYVGRSLDNDIRIDDKTVSRRHLKISKHGNRCFIADRKSRNGTFYSGSYMTPGIEIQVKECTPIVIGMSVICLGEGCDEKIMPALESTGLASETGDQSGIFLVHREKTNQKKLELIHKVAEALSGNLSINEALEKILEYALDLLKVIDKAVFVLVDPETKKILDVISKSSRSLAGDKRVYCPDVVKRVIEERKPIVVSDVQSAQPDEIAETLKIMRIESVICVPLISDSQIMGVIYIESRQSPLKFAKEDISLFVDICKRTASALETMRFAFNSTSIGGSIPSKK